MTPSDSNPSTSENPTIVPGETQSAKDVHKYHLTGMYQNWFLDYASYVILERAVPHLNDGLKPVQRRILHCMKQMDDGRYNKVAGIVGDTMKYHPHGDASIGDALVQLGQKDLLIDCQGNWGNILTGDGAAAPRYIEARLSKFALDVVFNPKTTDWKMSYDGRNKEPITLPIKFPLLLAQGVEGIAVGLSSKILPHNFNELIDASVSHLRGEDFVIYPDFQTGGFVDISRYNDGERGGSVKVRAKIEKRDNKTLAITEIPFGRTTSSLIESILKAQERGKVKIKKIDDNTAAAVEILVHLLPGTSSDKTIDALYALTDCEVSISPNCCLIYDNKPCFMTVKEVLRVNTENTMKLLRQELLIEKDELLEKLLFCTLEKIFIQERIYKDKGFEESSDMDQVIDHIGKRLEPFMHLFIREIYYEDMRALMEIKMARILRFNADKADQLIAEMNQRVEQIDFHLNHLVDYTVAWFEKLKEKYGKSYPRMTVIRGFDTIEATKVVEANEKLYINREEGFIGTGLKKDEYVCNCSDIDDVILFYKDGKYKVVKVAEKMFVGKNVLYLNVFKRNDNRTIYNVIYRDGKEGFPYMKRFAVTGVTRDKEYDLTQGKPGSKILWFSANPNGEAEILKIVLKPKPRLRSLVLEKDFGEIAIKGRQSMGNIVTKNELQRISLKEKGGSTLGGRQVWFDPDVLRLNYDGRGTFLGEFQSDDSILVVLKSGQFYTSTFDASNHYESDILLIEKYDPDKIWTAVLYDADQQGYPYLKRFNFESSNKKQSYLGDNPDSSLILLSDKAMPRLKVVFGAGDQWREALMIEAENFIAIKGFKAKGKRITTFSVAEIIDETPEEEIDSELTEIDESIQEEGTDTMTDDSSRIEEILQEDSEDMNSEVQEGETLVEARDEPAIVQEEVQETVSIETLETPKIVSVDEDDFFMAVVSDEKPKKEKNRSAKGRKNGTSEDTSTDNSAEQMTLFDE